MPASVLIAYATRSGSTGEVAEAIGAVLRDAGLFADVAPAHEVLSLAGKSALILGAPLYVGRLPREFHAFVRLHRERLSSLRPWCFVLGPTRSRPEDFGAARAQAEKQLDRYAWLHPADLHIFGGRWNAQSIPFPFSVARHLPGNPLDKIPGSDLRDWTEIRQWASGIAHQLLPAA
jgi:menaquinone-dependent protoporphyrinogen oxidase